MHKSEYFIIGIVLGAIPVVFFFVAGWWLSIPFIAEQNIVWFALAGLGIGLLVDFVFLKSWCRQIYSAKPAVWLAVYVFYSICIFGFFIGVPVFHVLLGFPAGFFVAGLLLHEKADVDRKRRIIRKSSLWISVILTIVCLSSGTIALLSSSTGSELQHMLNLPVQITVLMILAIIVIGGIFLLAVQWFIFRESVAFSCRYLAARGNQVCN